MTWLLRVVVRCVSLSASRFFVSQQPPDSSLGISRVQTYNELIIRTGVTAVVARLGELGLGGGGCALSASFAPVVGISRDSQGAAVRAAPWVVDEGAIA